MPWKLADAGPVVSSCKESCTAAEDLKDVLWGTIKWQGGMPGKMDYRNDVQAKASARKFKTTTSGC